MLQSVFTCLWLLWSHINYCKINMSAWLSLEGWSNSRCSHGQKWFIRGWQDCFCMFVGIVRVGVMCVWYCMEDNVIKAELGVVYRIQIQTPPQVKNNNDCKQISHKKLNSKTYSTHAHTHAVVIFAHPNLAFDLILAVIWLIKNGPCLCWQLASSQCVC